jgi:hypothetical protein
MRWMIILQEREEFEDTKEAIRIRKSKNRQHNGSEDPSVNV